jgi:transcriptional regulator with XRE-family HTH domain
MSFKDTLAVAIENSGLTIREISKKCEELGMPITHSYISQLRSGKSNPPSEEIIKILSKICDINENVLILEAYLDKAPSYFINLLEIIKMDFNNNSINNLNFIERGMDTIQYTADDKIIINKEYINKEKKRINERTLAECLVEEYENISYNTLSQNGENIGINYAENTSQLPYIKVDIQDNAMAPIIPKNSKAYFEASEKYIDGDIICFLYNDDILVRKYFIKEDIVILNPINSQFEPIIYISKDIKILGKVKRVINYM